MVDDYKFKELYEELGKRVSLKKIKKSIISSKKGVLKNKSFYFYFLKKTIKINSKDKILDVGCGLGGPMYYLGIKKYIGIDISSSFLKIAHKLFKKPKFIEMDVTRGLKFDSNYFDYIFCFETIEHIPKEKIPFFLDELHRVLKKNGKIIITTPNKLKWIYFPFYYLIPQFYRPKILNLFKLISDEDYKDYKDDMELEKKIGINEHVNMYSSKRLICELKKQKFKIILKKGFGTILDYKYIQNIFPKKIINLIKRIFPKDRILIIAIK